MQIREFGLSKEDREKVYLWAYKCQQENHIPLERIQEEFPEMKIKTPDSPFEIWVECGIGLNLGTGFN
jgi:hypothetical protein